MPQLKRNYHQKLIREKFGGRVYEYLPLGNFVVASPRVCGGRPTVKYTRIDARHILGFLEAGDTPEFIAESYSIPIEAIYEVIKLADRFDYELSYV